MRQIKFRAWNAANSRMEYDLFYIHQATGNCHYFGDGIGVASNPEFYDCGEEEPVLMQYTGLKDQKKIEIFEGDILNIDGKIMVVEYDECCFRTPYNGSNYRLGGWKPGTIKVIGNIFQHSHLLPVTTPNP